MSRTDALLEAIRIALEARRREIDAADDLRGIQLDVRFKPRSWTPRAVVVNTEREHVFGERASEQKP